MKTYSFKDSPLEIHGIPFFDKTKEMYRLPREITDKPGNLSFYGRISAGARLCFKTNSKKFKVKIALETLQIDIGMSIYACQSAFVLAGERHRPRFLGLVRPDNYEMKTFEATFTKDDSLEDITIYLPRNEIIRNTEVEFDDGAEVLSPSPYKDIKPVLYYGSSITEGGCCSTCFNAYNAIISSRLNVDYYNLGFSGSALGEIEVADYINTIDMSLFVYDYDHNAPTPEHLKKTHEPFFLRIREKHPKLPVLMMSRPGISYTDEEKERREIIYKTYTNAIRYGDENVYFIDGETFYGEEDRVLCTMDIIHPNDLGMLKMANVIEPVISEILKTGRMY